MALVIALAAPGVAAAEPAAAPAPRTGATVEAAFGVGFAHLGAPPADDGGGAINTGAGATLGVGLGGWLTPRLALTARVVALQVGYNNAGNVQNVPANLFVGPELQYWPTANAWFAAGAGLAVQYTFGDCEDCATRGTGFDLRAGYAADNGFQLSVELTPSFYTSYGISSTVTGFAVLAGYQFL